MKRSLITLWLLSIALIACGDSGGSTLAGNPDIDGAISRYTTANEALKLGDLDAAKSAYQTILQSGGDATTKSRTSKSLSNGTLADALSEYEQSVAGTPNDPVANFGLGLITLAQLGESPIGAAILAKFGQPPLATSLVLGPNGYLAALDQMHQSCQKGTPSKKLLPFGTLAPMKHHWWWRVLSQAKSDLTSYDLFQFSLAIIPTLQDVIAEWKIAALDPNFSFTLPKELFYANEDIVLTHADLTLGIAALDASIAGIGLANSWTADIDLGKLVDANGNMLLSNADLVAIANKFFALTSNANNEIPRAKNYLHEALDTAQSALDEYLVSNGAAALVVNNSNTAGVQELLTLVQEARASFDATTTISTTKPVLHVNLGNFFAHPPDANNIDIDPFVLETKNSQTTVKWVESFFQQFLNDADAADLHFPLKKNFSIFTTAVKNKKFRNTTFANFSTLFKDSNVPGCPK